MKKKNISTGVFDSLRGGRSEKQQKGEKGKVTRPKAAGKQKGEAGGNWGHQGKITGLG